MVWKEELSVGVKLIDDEHKSLIQAVNDLFDACSQGKGRAKIAETMKFMEDYTVKHFRDEENLQLRYSYPGYAAHHALHQGFVQDIQGYKKQLEENGPTIKLVAEFNSFVSTWLIKHISIEDRKIGVFVRAAETAK